MRQLNILRETIVLDPFVQSIQRFRWKSAEELCLVTLKSDAKFEVKMTLLVPKMTLKWHSVNFDASSDKPENLPFHVLLFSIVHKVSAKKVPKNDHSWQWKNIFEGKLTFYLKNEMRNLVTFNLSSGK